MPTYDYKCPECGWTGSRRCKVADRDAQTCDVRIITDFDWRSVSIMPDGSMQPEGTVRDSQVCGKPLVRDEISLTASMSYNWGSWH